MMKNKKPNTGTVFVSPPGYIYLPRALQHFLYLVLEASYARDLHFYIVAPNLSINVTTWRPCEASYPAFLADISKAIQGYTGYRGNSQLIVDEATAYDYGMRMSIRSLDENGVRKVLDPNESERKHLIDNLGFERRDESTLDEKTIDPKFHKELLALFKETEMIKAERTNTTVFPIAAIAIDAKLDMVLASVDCKSRNSISNVTDETYNSKDLEKLSRFLLEKLQVSPEIWRHQKGPPPCPGEPLLQSP